MEIENGSNSQLPKLYSKNGKIVCSSFIFYTPLTMNGFKSYHISSKLKETQSK